MKIHIFGASGTGTTTIGLELSKELKIPFFDSDDYFWEKTDLAFQKIRVREERQALLQQDLEKHANWIVSGAFCEWGDFLIPQFTLAIFLYVPHDIRMQRLDEREVLRYGTDITSIDHPMNAAHELFISWASKYDTAGLDMRSKAQHEEWIKILPCKVLRIEGDLPVSSIMQIVLMSGYA